MTQFLCFFLTCFDLFFCLHCIKINVWALNVSTLLLISFLQKSQITEMWSFLALTHLQRMQCLQPSSCLMHACTLLCLRALIRTLITTWACPTELKPHSWTEDSFAVVVPACKIKRNLSRSLIKRQHVSVWPSGQTCVRAGCVVRHYWVKGNACNPGRKTETESGRTGIFLFAAGSTKWFLHSKIILNVRLQAGIRPEEQTLHLPSGPSLIIDH